MSQEGRAAFAHIKDLLSQSSQLVIMNEEDPLILYTDASTKAIGGVHHQVAYASSKGNREACNLHFSFSLRSGHALGYHGIGTLRVRLLCEESHTLPTWKAIHSSHGS